MTTRNRDALARHGARSRAIAGVTLPKIGIDMIDIIAYNDINSGEVCKQLRSAIGIKCLRILIFAL